MRTRRQRQQQALTWICQVLDPADVSEQARLTAAVGLIICDNHGTFTPQELDTAMRNPKIIKAAEKLLKTARETDQP